MFSNVSSGVGPAAGLPGGDCGASMARATGLFASKGDIVPSEIPSGSSCAQRPKFRTGVQKLFAETVAR